MDEFWPSQVSFPSSSGDKETDGNRESKDWLEGQGGLIESGFPGERRKGLVEGLVLQSEDLQMLTHSYVRHITICQLL